MATKTIKAWINGSVQMIEVEDISMPEQELTLEERVEILENKPVIGSTYTTVTLLASAWEGYETPYSQVVAIDGVTENSMVDLQPTPEQLVYWQDEGLAFTAVNDDGIIYVYVAGGKPIEDIVVQAKIQEVATV